MVTLATRPIGKLEQLAYDRAAADHARWPATSVEECEPDGYWFDEAEAERKCSIFPEMLRHHKGEWAGKPFVLEEFQRFQISEVFGWKRPDGSRRFRAAYIEIPRKNGKTEEAAGVAIILTAADNEAGAEVYSAATKKDQAKICHDAATAMVKQSPDLRRFVGLRRNNIHCERLSSRFEPLGADADTLDGLNTHGLVVDELHAHRDRRVVDVLETSMGSRRQPLTWYITTAGVYDPESIGWQIHVHATQILEGIYDDPTFFAFIAAADPEDDWREVETWRKANPNYGVSVRPEFLAEQARKAEQQPRFENSFKRYYLNIWTEQKTRWLRMDKWQECDGPLDIAALEGRACYGGLDLSTTNDLAAFLLVFPPLADEPWALLPRFYLPEARIEEAARGQIRAPYDAWHRDGHLFDTPGEVLDYAFIRKDINDASQRFSITAIGYDPWNANQIRHDLEGDGFQMAEVRQGFKSLSEPSKFFEKLVISGKIRHGNHPILRWNAANVTVRTDPNGNIAPQKEDRNSPKKIDGIAAAIIALSLAVRSVASSPAFPYRTRGIRTL